MSRHVHTRRNDKTGRLAFVSWDNHNECYEITMIDGAGRTETETISPDDYDPDDHEDLNPDQRAKIDAVDMADNFAAGRPTNVEMIVRLMEHSRSGPLIQPFVIQSLDAFSKAVVEAGVEGQDPDGWINPEAWLACAKDVRTMLDDATGGGL
jgi:hypothetical protein